MCGVAVVITPFDQSRPSSSGVECNPPLIDCDCSKLLRRGPDSWFQTSVTHYDLSSSPVQIILLRSVLSQRGNSTTSQPLRSQPARSGSTYIFLWNGEVYAHTEEHANSLFANPSNNDGEVLLSLIVQAENQERVLDHFSSLFGPFAFILLELPAGMIYFGRDRYGRRSLVGRSKYNSLSNRSLMLDAISSVVLRPLQSGIDESKYVHQTWVELPASGIFSGQLRFVDQSWYITDITLHPWSPEHLAVWPSFGLNIARIAAPLAPLVTDLLELNVYPSQNLSQTLLDLLSSAVKDRVWLASSSCSDCSGTKLQPPYENHPDCTHSKFAVLFSGGVDSTILSILCHRHVPADQPIDLINVAFEQPESHKTGSQGKPVFQPASEAPDRRTAWQSFHELCRVAPTRRWKLVLADVSSAELHSVRTSYIKDLLLPGHLTVLDDSLGLAMWFAARGLGRCCEAPISSPGSLQPDPEIIENVYRSPAKTVFVGTGVDEQLSGYTRHRVIYAKHGPEALEAELRKEMQRISERNLGRDDRVISDHGREARFPYLDERVVHFLRKVPIQHKVDFSLPKGAGEKRLLRLVAMLLGLTEAATLPKRAMQFGSCIAKAHGSSRLTGPADQTLMRVYQE